MKTLFIYPVPDERHQMTRYQQGIGSIAAVLKKAGHQVELLVMPRLDLDAIDRRVREFGPGVVAMSLTSGFFPMGREIAARVAAAYRLPVIIGGIHATLCPEETIAAEGVSAICMGEGEYPMLEYCTALEAGSDPAAIRNLWVKRTGGITRNPMRPLINDLDSLPFPDREVFGFGKMIATYPEAEFMGSRGCPYQCAYCANHAINKLYKGKGSPVRFRSVENLLAEVDDVLRKYPAVSHLGFHDDTFTLNPKWAREFAEKYPARFSKPFWCNTTAPSITDETAALLKKAGCAEVRVGVESGNDDIRMRVLQKNVKRSEIVEGFRILRRHGINSYAFNMVGLPYETRSTIEDTIRLNREIRATQVFVSAFYPYPGTKAYEICRDNGWLTGKSVGSYFERDYVLNQPTISAREVLYYKDIFLELVRCPRPVPSLWMARTYISPEKTLWNAWRRVRAKFIEFGMLFKPRRQDHAGK